MKLAQIRQSVERYSQEISKAYYLQGAGLEDNIDFDSIYSKYSGLFSLDNLAVLKNSASTSDDPDEKKRVNSLLEAFYGEMISQKQKSLVCELLELESTSTIEIEEGKSVPYRSSVIYLMNEPSAEKREQIEKNIEQFVAGKLNSVLERTFLLEESSIKELGFANKVEMFSKLSGIDLHKTDEEMQKFLEETDELYSKYVGLLSEKILKIPAGELKRHDLMRLMRTSQFDDMFPKEDMFRVINSFAMDLGFNIRSHNRINLDLEPRSNKSARAFCSAVRIPEEVYLVLYPRGGENDYTVFLHELGHALHFSNVGSELEFEYRWYGDNSVTEAYAMTFDHLTMNNAWMNRYLGLKLRKNDEYFKHKSVNELISLRVLAAKIHYEIKLYETPGLEGKKELFRDIFERTLKVKCTPVNYLVNIDNYFYCVRYIRAWMLQSNISEFLNREYGELWFESKGAGEELLSWWCKGQKYNADDLSIMKCGSKLSISTIKRKINDVLMNN